MYVLFVLIGFIVIPILTIFLGLQVIALGDFIKSEFQTPFKFEFNVLRYLEYKEFLYLVIFIIFISLVSVLWNGVFSQRARERFKIRHLTLDERKRYSHLASTHEAKKGTQRLEFNSKGVSLGNKTFKGFLDVNFNWFKVLYNKILSKLKISDVHKLNTLKKFKIEGNESGRRGGVPIVTKKNKIWVDAEDTNSLIIGATRSGKTYGIINILIQSLRMAGESALIMDVKGELYDTHAQSFINDGYEVYKPDFINPSKSTKWNPFGVIIKKYRQAYNDWLLEMEDPNNVLIVKKIATKTSILRENLNKQKKANTSNEINNLKLKENSLRTELEQLFEIMPKPDYSEAKEYILDIAQTLCNEKDSKDPFWPSSAATLLDGYINFLLEEKIEDGKGGWTFLPDNMINMYSVKMLHDLGKTTIPNAKQFDNCKNVLQYYVNHYRKVDDASSMKLKAYIDAPDNTAGSISSVFDDKIKYFLANESILAMTSESEFDIKDLGRKKVAVFVGIHDEKSTFHSLASILFSQVYEELIKEARNVGTESKSNQRLKNDVMVVWDEFANGARWDNINNALSAGLSRGVRYTLVIQDYGQLYNLYGKDISTTIKSNCQNTFYLLANDIDTLKEISERCGTELKWNHNKNDKVELSVMSVDTLSNLSMGEAIVLRGRKNPYKTRLLGFNSYNFYKNLPKAKAIESRKNTNVSKYNILKAWSQRRENDDKLKMERSSGQKDRNGIMHDEKNKVRDRKREELRKQSRNQFNNAANNINDDSLKSKDPINIYKNEKLISIKNSTQQDRDLMYSSFVDMGCLGGVSFA